MACDHKFSEYLNLTALQFKPTTLIVGTFNPLWPEGNAAEWFYGRTRNNYFWDVLPRLFNPNLNLRMENTVQWKTFCTMNQVALTDLIYSIRDADEVNEEHQEILRTYQDTSIADYFQDFDFTDIVQLLIDHPTITNVYLTRQPGIELFDNRWQLVQEYCQANGLHVRNLLTPSASARFQIRDYRLANPNDPTPLKNFIFQQWQQQWHENNG